MAFNTILSLSFLHVFCFYVFTTYGMDGAEEKMVGLKKSDVVGGGC